MRAAKAVHIHAALAILWTLLLIPTLVWWKDSILWIGFMSLYAIVVTHISALQGARAERKVDEQ